jgi:hypothetical protein
MTEQQTKDREEVQWKNDLAMQKVLEESGATLRAASAHTWRPTLRVKGNIIGIYESATIVATDGLLGLFQMHDQSWNFAHIQKFDGKISPLNSASDKSVKEKNSKPRKPSKKSLRQQILDNL